MNCSRTCTLRLHASPAFCLIYCRRSRSDGLGLFVYFSVLNVVSGEVPQEPVVSRKTGHVFEKRLIEKHLASSDKCPITGEDLSVDDLIAVKAHRTVAPRDLTATSIPGILALFQKEWDATMLESHTLKKNLQTLRQELSQALYQHDAACRCIARLITERDQAVAAYQDLQKRVSQGAATGAAPAADGKSVPQNVLQAMSAKAEELKAARKKRVKPATLATKEQVESFKQTSSHTPHSAAKAGITCVDIHPVQQNFVATGGVDKVIKVFDREQQKTSATVSGHSKKVNAVAWHPTQAVLFSASDDATVRVWAAEGENYTEKIKLTEHTAATTGIAVHPTGSYFASSSLDGSWKLHDCTTSTTVTSVQDITAGDKGVTALAYHPDGMILGTGSGTGTISLWDMKKAAAAELKLEGHTGALTSLSFSENGYSLATGSTDGTVRLWDLRKFKCVKTLEVGNAVNSVRFDHSGTYLAAGSNDTRVLHVKSWSTKATFTDSNGAPVLGVALTNDAQVVASVSLDRSLRFYGQ